MLRLAGRRCDPPMRRSMHEAVALQDSIEFQKYLASVKFRMVPTGPARPSLYVPEITDNDDATVSDALRAFIRIIVEASEPDLVDKMSGEVKQAAAQLRSIVPRQKIAPVQFEVADGRLQIAHQNAQSRARDLNNVNSAREIMIERGRKLIQHLGATNCDHRLLETMRYSG